MIQLDLFGNPVEAHIKTSTSSEVTKADWSYSKMQAFRNCPRKYYYRYYGSKKRTAKEEPLKDTLIELTKLSNKYAVQGNLIHQMVSLFFNKSKKGDFWDYNRISNFANKILSETLLVSEAVSNGKSVENSKYPKPLLKELIDKKVTMASLLNEMREVIDECLRNFFNNDNYEHLRVGGQLSDSKVESATCFELTDTINIDGKVDLAFFENEKLVIADWKTGKKDYEDTSLQLLVYALWAQNFKEFSYREISIQKAYLYKGSLEELEYSDIHIQRATTRIIQDVEILNELSEYGNKSIADAFTQHMGDNCLSCPYENICHK